jgi:hypothetical protein
MPCRLCRNGELTSQDLEMLRGSSGSERLGLDDEGGHARVRTRFVLFTRLPENGLARDERRSPNRRR